MSSVVFSCHVQHATPQIINPFPPHIEFATHDLRSTRTVIYNFVSANHLMGSLSPMFILPRNSPYTHYSHRVSHVPGVCKKIYPHLFDINYDGNSRKNYEHITS